LMRVSECAHAQGVKGLTEEEVGCPCRARRERGRGLESGGCLLRVVVEGWDWRVINGRWERK
jgi:hypothetical protein